MKLRDLLLEKINKTDLVVLEAELDRLFAKYGIDIEFTYHFKQRLNDRRNRQPITIAELRRIFRHTHKKYGRKLSRNEESFEAVLKDVASNINIPFVLKDDPVDGDKDFISKTVMRKKNFGTSNKVYEV